MTCTAHFCEQRSDEWHGLRRGRLCGSSAPNAYSEPKTAGYTNLVLALALERISGRTLGGDYENQAMRNGREREPIAIGLYQAVTGILVEPVGFYSHPEMWVGYSPDGVVGDVDRPTGLVEVKCPEWANHWEYASTGIVPPKYLRQIRHGLWLTGAEWCDFVTYNPDFPESLQLRVIRVLSNEGELAEHDRVVRSFLSVVAKKEAAIRTMAGTAGQLRASMGGAA